MVTIPDYQGGCIVNLMSSIIHACGGQSRGYPLLRDHDRLGLEQAQNIVLMVIDGLGYEYLQRHPESTIHQYFHGRLDSVAPPTTAASVSTFLTGEAPQQHGLTGWFTWMRELGSLVTVLPFQHRAGRLGLAGSNITPKGLFGHVPVFDDLALDCYSIMPDWLTKSAFNLDHLGKARLVPHTGMSDFFQQISATVKAGSQRKYLYAYWPAFDAMAHDKGVNSPQAAAHFARLDEAFVTLLDNLAGTDTVLLLTADHGFIDTTEETRLSVNDHPELMKCLQLPLCGEPRLAYAYVRYDKRTQFIDYMTRELSHAATVYEGAELIENGLYGLGEPHPELHSRVGDFVLVMKDNYTFTQTLPGEERMNMIGQHGGLSAAEMQVPLVVAGG